MTSNSEATQNTDKQYDNSLRFFEETLLVTPKPQASSTVNRKADASLDDEVIVVAEMDKADESECPSTFLSNERDAVGSLNQRLNEMFAQIRRDSVNTDIPAAGSEANSSFGILKLDEMEDLNLTDTSKILESLIPTANDDCEMSWRMTRELARQSVSSRSSAGEKIFILDDLSFMTKPKISEVGDASTSSDFAYKQNDDCFPVKENDLSLGLNNFASNSDLGQSSEKARVFNPFDGGNVSGFSAIEDEFDSGEDAKKRLMADDASWMQERADMPVPYLDKSLSGIFPGEDGGVADVSSVSTFLRGGSGPLGTLDHQKDPSQRPNFGTAIFSPLKNPDDSVSGNTSVACITEVVPKQCNALDATQSDVQLNSTVSSIASISHIQEMLGDMSIHSSPRLVIDKMLNVGSKNNRKHKSKHADKMENLKNTYQDGLDKMMRTSKFDSQMDSENSCNRRKNLNDIQIIDITSTHGNHKDTTEGKKKDANEQNIPTPLRSTSSGCSRNILKDATNLQRPTLKTIDVEMDSTFYDDSETNNKAELDRLSEDPSVISDSSSLYSIDRRKSDISSLNEDDDDDCVIIEPLSRSTSVGEIDRILVADCRDSVPGENNFNSVCIGTICKFEIQLANDSSDKNLNCSLSVKSVIRDGKLSPESVHLLFPKELVITPTESKAVEIQVLPVDMGCIEIIIQVKQVEQDSSDVHFLNCVAKIRGERPKLVVRRVRTDEQTLNNVIDFGLMPEESVKQTAIRIENPGRFRIPILLEFTKVTSDFMVFHVNESADNEVVKKLIILDPGAKIEEAVHCFTPPLNNKSKKIERITGHLSVSLAGIGVNPIKFAEFNLRVSVGFTRVLIAGNCNPLIIEAFQAPKALIVRNAGVVPVTLNLTAEDSEFSVLDQKIFLGAGQGGSVDVSYATFSTEKEFHSVLWLSVESSEVRFKVNLVGKFVPAQGTVSSRTINLVETPKRPGSQMTSSSSSPIQSKTTTPYTSRSSSPCSTNLSSAERGSLDLASTCSALVWASCPLQSVQKKSCVLRNKNNFKEKLLLSVVDNHNCYKLVEENGQTVQETRLNLEAMESRQVAVSMCPLQVGSCKGSLVITRANQRPVPGQPHKKVLHLYGYGGKAVLNIRGVFRDPEHKMWTYLDSGSLHTSFLLENSGDGSAFVRIGQEIAATGVVIIPHEALIPAHKSISVELSFSPTAGRADHLLSESSADDVLSVTRITITYGDEATRLRLKRLYRKIIDEKSGADSLLMERLAVLDNLFPGTNASEVSCLKDTLISIKTLWTEGIRETSIGVLLDRAALENAELDTTAQFIDLATTVTDDTMYCPKQQLIVAPRVVNLSWTQPSASFSLRNTTMMPIKVRIESVPGLLVDPQTVCLQSHSSCMVTVRHATGCDLALSSVLKIFSDSTDTIEVPVNWNKVYL